MNALKLLIILILAGVYSKFAHGIGADRDLNTALITAKQITTPPNPSSGFSRIYVKADGKAYILASDGTEKPLGSGAGGNILNLLEDGSFEDGVVEATCSSCTASQQTTGAIVTPFNTSFLRAAFSASTGNVIVCGNSSNVDGVQGKVSGWVKTDQADVVVYPRIDSVDISSLSKPVSSDGEWRYYEIPVPMGATNACLKIEATSSITGNVDVDDVFVGAAKVTAELGIQTGWKSCTTNLDGIITDPTFGTIVTNLCQYKRNGSSMDIRWDFRQSSTGSNGSGVYLFKLPENLTIDTSKIQVNTTGGDCSTGILGGSLKYGDNVTNITNVPYAFDSNSISFCVSSLAGTEFFSSSNNLFGSAANAVVSAYVTGIPIAEWSATTDIYSSSAEGSNVRLDTANGYGSSATAIRRFTNERVNFGSGINYVDDATNGSSFTATRSGFYFASYYESANSSSGIAAISLNASNLAIGPNSLADSEVLCSQQLGDVTNAENFGCAWVGWLNAGDIIRPHTNSFAPAAAGRTKFSIVSFSDMLIGLFKDVVTSPGSSNGKPILYSAKVSVSGAVSDEKGGSGMTCTNANPFICSFNGIFSSGSSVNCQVVASDTSNNRLARLVGFPTSTSVSVFTIEPSVPSAAQSQFSIMCHGEKP